MGNNINKWTSLKTLCDSGESSGANWTKLQSLLTQ